MPTRTLAFLASFVLFLGCKPHVQLTSPGKAGTFSARCKSYLKLRPAQYEQTITVYQNGTRVEDELSLANKTKVYHVEDLRPIIDPDSPTAQALDAAASQESKRNMYGAATAASVALWFALVIRGPDDAGFFDPPASLAMAAGAVLSFFAYHHDNKATDARWEAMKQYDPSLRMGLSLSESDLQTCIEATTPTSSDPPRAIPK